MNKRVYAFVTLLAFTTSVSLPTPPDSLQQPSFLSDVLQTYSTPKNARFLLQLTVAHAIYLSLAQSVRRQHYMPTIKQIALFLFALHLKLLVPEFDGQLGKIGKIIAQNPNAHLQDSELVAPTAGLFVLVNILFLGDLAYILFVTSALFKVYGLRGDKQFWMRELNRLLFKHTFKQADQSTIPTQCPVCYEEKKELHDWVSPCIMQNHVFCKECALTWAKEKLECPTCRGDFVGNRTLKSIPEVLGHLSSGQYWVEAACTAVYLMTHFKYLIKKGTFFLRNISLLLDYQDMKRRVRAKVAEQRQRQNMSWYQKLAARLRYNIKY